MLNDDEMAWLDEQMRGDVDHLLVGTSLPFLLSPGLHYVEAWDEALAGGAWGKGRAAASRRATADDARPRALGARSRTASRRSPR